MKIINIKSLAIPGVQVLTFERFKDERGYFTELFRKSDFKELSDLLGIKSKDFIQVNESRSKKSVVRGLHFQWEPLVGKLVRVITGRMVDIALDIRHGSPVLGKIIMYEMAANPMADSDQWIWLPPGIAHGNFFSQETIIEYFCTGEYNPKAESGISPFDPELDWSLCQPVLKDEFMTLKAGNPLCSDKDKKGSSLSAWLSDPRSLFFSFFS
jgi:dTDP-4-dehydrorhamnose 3,5-epimerase